MAASPPAGSIPTTRCFPISPPHGIIRNLYKHVAGTSVLFEEIHETLQLVFRWELTASEHFGLVRTCRLENLADAPREVRLLDGWTHLLPHGVSQETYPLQLSSSRLHAP